MLKELRAAATLQNRVSAVRIGLAMDEAYGVSVAKVRAIAKRLKDRHALAQPLWASGIHEARLLAILVADPTALSQAAIERWLSDVTSWDLCDHLCGELVCRRSDAAQFVRRWSQSAELYAKRAAFALIAQLSVRAKLPDDERLDGYLDLIAHGANDPRRHVRQEVSWALRAIGKCNGAWHDHALAVAAELMESDSPAQRWVGRNAMRELETLVKVPERRLLLSSKSKMGRKAVRSQHVRAVRARARPRLPG